MGKIVTVHDQHGMIAGHIDMDNWQICGSTLTCVRMDAPGILNSIGQCDPDAKVDLHRLIHVTQEFKHPDGTAQVANYVVSPTPLPVWLFPSYMIPFPGFKLPEMAPPPPAPKGPVEAKEKVDGQKPGRADGQRGRKTGGKPNRAA